MTPTDSDTRSLDLEAVTRDYARYAERAGGLSAVAGGVLCLVSYGLGATLAPTPSVRVVLLAIPLAWLLARQWMTRRFYQRYGRVDELHDAGRTRTQRWLVIGMAAIVAMVLFGYLADFDNPAMSQGLVERILYLLFVLSIPFIAWRWLRTPIDLVIGAFLLSQAALAAAGTTHAAWSSALVFLPVALLMIAGGLRDHARFRKLQQRIRELAHSGTEP